MVFDFVSAVALRNSMAFGFGAIGTKALTGLEVDTFVLALPVPFFFISPNV